MIRKWFVLLELFVYLIMLASCGYITNESYRVTTDSDTSSVYTNLITTPSVDTSDAQFDELTENPATDFQYEVSPNGRYVYINKYIGAAKNVIIPTKINDLPVTALNGIAYNDNGAFEGAFENCSIETVFIPEAVQSIGYKAFKGCEELSNVTISPKSNMTIIGGSAFENCINLVSFDFSLTNVTVLDGLSFAGCTNLKDIKFPDSLLEIGEQAFYECSSISEIKLPKNLAKIGKSAFACCTALKNITIPTTLDLFAYEEPPFHNNSSLEKITFEEGREEISGYAFFSTTTNVEILIPESVKSFSPYPFFISGTAEIVFLGDCPEIIEKDDFYGEPTIYFDSNTKGWYECAWRNKYPLIEIEK